MIERAHRCDAARVQRFVAAEQMIEARVTQLHVMQAGRAFLIVGLAAQRGHFKYAQHLGIRVSRKNADKSDVVGTGPGGAFGVVADEKRCHVGDGFIPVFQCGEARGFEYDFAELRRGEFAAAGFYLIHVASLKGRLISVC